MGIFSLPFCDWYPLASGLEREPQHAFDNCGGVRTQASWVRALTLIVREAACSARIGRLETCSQFQKSNEN
eukprot:4275374-Pyramimonas_sp.AAC.2